MDVISLFSGCGGLDLGFTNAGFKTVFANDNDPDVWETYGINHKLKLCPTSIVDITAEELPDADGFIGGPPCQSWSLAGAMRGIKDERGMLFYEYMRLLKDKKPKFFLAENVPGIISSTHYPEFLKLLKKFDKIGYDIAHTKPAINAADYGVPQDRKRVFVVGYRKDLGMSFEFPEPNPKKISLREAIGNLPKSVPAKEKNYPNVNLKVPNHEHMIGGFSTIYMSRNRRRDWSQQSFTIQAGGRHAPLHPDSCEMVKVDVDKRVFKPKNGWRRRLSVRECARIQTFPDWFVFKYAGVADGYKMIGNAVPVKLAEAIARKIMEDFGRG